MGSFQRGLTPGDLHLGQLVISVDLRDLLFPGRGTELGGALGPGGRWPLKVAGTVSTVPWPGLFPLLLGPGSTMVLGPWGGPDHL